MLITRHLRSRRTRGRRRESGYMLLTVLLFVTLLVLASAAVAPRIKMQIERDREEEMIHRGVQYSRAIKRFYKKFGRYPNTLEELENTNNLRFLRRRYKDPVTGKNFRLLHYGEVTMFAQGVPGLAAAGAAGIANGPGIPGQQLAAQQGFGGLAQVTPLGQPIGGLGSGAANPAAMAAAPNPEQAPAGGPGIPGAGPGQPTTHTSGEQPEVDASQSGGGQPEPAQQKVFGGGGILGVASVSPKKTIREFNKKNHYKDWQFVYDPSLDRGGLLTGPSQPPLPGSAVPAVPGQQPQPTLPGFTPQALPPLQQQQPQQTPQQNPFPQQPPDIPQQ
jgi:type II secretory pathway pseudopilin PulG